MMPRIQQLGRDSIIYGLGGIAARCIAFLLLPVYTRVFPPSEFGTIEMLLVIISLLSSIMNMGLDAAQSFYFFEKSSKGTDEQALVITAVLKLRILSGGAIVIGATFLAPALNKVLFLNHLSFEYFAIAFSSAFFIQIMNQSADIFRLLYRPFGYISIILVQTIIGAGVALSLILIFDYGILGYLYGSLSGAFVAAIIGWWYLRENLIWSGSHIKWFPKLIKFGIPLAPVGLIQYVLNSSDRWFISQFSGQEHLGIYAIGAKFAMLVSVIVITFRRAWWPIAMEAIHSPEGPTLYRAVARLYMGVGCSIVVMVTAISPFLVKWFTTQNYYMAYPIIGILSWSSIFYGFYLISSGGIWKAKKTVWSTVLMGISAALNLLFNSWLVPTYGGIGASIATSISFAIWIILTLCISNKYWKINYQYHVMAFQIVIGVCCTYFILFLYMNNYGALVPLLISCLAVGFLLGSSVPIDQYHKLFRNFILKRA